MSHVPHKVEFGDFQTPAVLAEQVALRLQQLNLKPRSLVEPTCGQGTLLLAAAHSFAKASHLLGVEINAAYAAIAKERLAGAPQSTMRSPQVRVDTADFFTYDWPAAIASLPQPILFVGNPPWVTNSELARRSSDNRPARSNHQSDRGIDAITGKANFDISETIIQQCADLLDGTSGMLAMLCKTRVARRVLQRLWNSKAQIQSAALYEINAQQHFSAAVDAGLLVIEFQPGTQSTVCSVHPDLDAPAEYTIGITEGKLVSHRESYERWKHLGGGERGVWRSGIKHDCAKIMQLRRGTSDTGGESLTNGQGEVVDIEPEFRFPLLKSSDLTAEKLPAPRFEMLVPQRSVGQDTERLRELAPRTWEYLQAHADRLHRRRSSIYRGKPPFSIFGVGEYSFAPYKIAIAGLTKQLRFHLIEPFEGRPVVLDDSCYFTTAPDRAQAVQLLDRLTSVPATEFLESQIFWDAKRPVTAELLNSLDLNALARVTFGGTI